MELLILAVLLCFIYMLIQTRKLSRRFTALRSQVDEGSYPKKINENIEKLRSQIEQLERENEGRNEKVSSRSFELLDGDNRTRARLETSEEGPCLFLYDAADQVPVAFFGFSGEKYPSIGLFYSGRSTAYGIRNAQATNLAQADANEGSLGITDSQITLSIDDARYPALSMYGRDE